ncbi:MAG: 3-phosphoshikimate 1-carboxyvinyltransferase [Bacteroidia bacterium]
MYILQYNNKDFNSPVIVNLTASKSVSNRVLILQKLLPQPLLLHNLSLADDTKLMLNALTIERKEINLNNAGTCMRFLTAYFSNNIGKTITLQCDERMKQRPINDLVNALKILGAQIIYLEKEGFPPLQITGQKLVGKTIEINASESSQFITALMLIGPFIQNGLTIELKGSVASFDYIKMTYLLMQRIGLNVFIENNFIKILPFQNQNTLAEYYIENDWSGASFWYLIATLNDSLSFKLNNLTLDSIQGDKITAEIFEALGVHTESKEDGIIIKKTKSPQNNLEFNLLNCIDLAPALCVACAALNINATITGLQNLNIKESNRLLAIITELNKFGYNAINNENTIFIKLVETIDYNKIVEINTYKDHRIAMAFTPLAILFSNIFIDEIDVVSKSYPDFFNEINKVGITYSTIL